MGKWAAIATLKSRKDNYPDLVRHPHDLVAIAATVTDDNRDVVKRLFSETKMQLDDVAVGLSELQRPVWEKHYNDYMRRMGKLDVGAFPPSHPLWEEVLDDLNHLAYDLGIVNDPNIPVRNEEQN